MQAGALQLTGVVEASQMSGDWQRAAPVHTPAWQTSPVVQGLLSLQAPPSLPAVWAEQEPVDSWQVPATWQTSVATEQVTGAPAHTPLAQVSPVVQFKPSLQVPPVTGVGAEQVPLGS
jgi:hypothetical protein